MAGVQSGSHLGTSVIHQMKPEYFTGNPPYSIPPYSSGYATADRPNTTGRGADLWDRSPEATKPGPATAVCSTCVCYTAVVASLSVVISTALL